MGIKVLLADDHRLFRDGLRQLLELESDIKIVGEAENGLEAERMALDTNPDVILMDINMPIVDGVAATRQILDAKPDVGIIILTMYRQDQHVFQAVRAGARGYLLKNTSPTDLVSAIRLVYSGSSLIDPEMATKLCREFARLADQMDPTEPLGGLTEKEIAILRLVAAGMSNKEIASELAFSEKTIKNQLSILFQKLGIRDRTQAAIYAMTHGLIPNEY
jgi:DNA-binding NarL/FixJ family response regulator